MAGWRWRSLSLSGVVRVLTVWGKRGNIIQPRAHEKTSWRERRGEEDRRRFAFASAEIDRPPTHPLFSPTGTYRLELMAPSSPNPPLSPPKKTRYPTPFLSKC